MSGELTKPGFLLGVANTAAIVSLGVYFHKDTNGTKTKVTELETKMATMAVEIGRVGRNNADSKAISNAFQQLHENNKTLVNALKVQNRELNLLKRQLAEVKSALRDKGVKVKNHLPDIDEIDDTADEQPEDVLSQFRPKKDSSVTKPKKKKKKSRPSKENTDDDYEGSEGE